MLTISTITASITGNVELDANAEYRENIARVSRKKTLDGGVYIAHSGVTDGDRTISVETSITENQAERLWYIFNNYTFINLGTPDGFFLAVISSLKIKDGKIKMSIMIKSKENV